MYTRQRQLRARVASRVATKRERAALVIQYYYKHKLQLGTGTRSLMKVLAVV